MPAAGGVGSSCPAACLNAELIGLSAASFLATRSISSWSSRSLPARVQVCKSQRALGPTPNCLPGQMEGAPDTYLPCLSSLLLRVQLSYWTNRGASPSPNSMVIQSRRLKRHETGQLPLHSTPKPVDRMWRNRPRSHSCQVLGRAQGCCGFPPALERPGATQGNIFSFSQSSRVPYTGCMKQE